LVIAAFVQNFADLEIVSHAFAGIRVCVCVLILDAVIKLGKKALVFALLRKIILEIPALYLLNALWPLYGLAYAQTTAEVVLAAAAVGVLARMFRSPDFREGT